jgi:hypothetical protein
MRGTARITLALWAVLAAIVFSVTFDFLTRTAAGEFMVAQAHRRIKGAPLDTIDNGFRPLVREAARRAAVLPALILVLGTGATLVAERHSR